MAEGVPPAAVAVRNTNPRQDRLRAQIMCGGGNGSFPITFLLLSSRDHSDLGAGRIFC
eukprot:COSAG05_NODE_654_length_8069_cov_3.646926_4_plen_58_part_00